MTTDPRLVNIAWQFNQVVSLLREAAQNLPPGDLYAEILDALVPAQTALHELMLLTGQAT